MSYNGSGTFVINSTGQPVVTGTVISSSTFNSLTADLGTGLTTAITKDGQTTTTAKIPFAQGISAAVASNFAAGTVGAPSIYLSTDTTTGLYRIGANNDGFAISGVKLLDLGSALVGITGALTVSTTLNVTGVATLGNGAVLGTPASGTVTNLTGTASININGTVGATTPTTGAFTSGTFSTTLGVTGTSTLAAVNASGNITIGGAAAVSPILRIEGDNASNKSILFYSNGVFKGSMRSSATAGFATVFEVAGAGGDALSIAQSGAVTIPGTLGVTGKTTLSTADFQVGSGNGVATPGLYCTSSVLWNFARDGNPAIEIARLTNDGALVNFYNSAGLVRGSISISGSNTAYNTTSDGTLKNKIGAAPVDVSKKLIMDSPVSEFTWKDDPTEKKHIGVIAQELYESGFHGAVNVGGMRTDEKGNEKYEPWAVDKTAFQYHLVVLAQEHESQIQSLLARIAALESK